MPAIADLYYHLFEGSSLGLKPPLVLIHGAGGTHLYWPSEIRRLPGNRVYAPDLPGHGKSSGRGRQTIGSYVDALLEWLTALDLALDYPERVIGLVLIGSGARLKVASELLDNTESATTYMNAVKLIVDWSFSKATPLRLKELAAQRIAETRASVLHGDLLACNEFNETERVNEILKPTLVVCGMEDRMMPPRYSQFLAEQIPDAELQLIHDAGHMVQLEKPQAVANAIINFVAGIKYI
jgi:pimeloyl-ACP methyl ester carboxylesterase